MRCGHPDGCLRAATGFYRLFPDRTQRALCEPHVASLRAMGLHVVHVESGWQARAIEHYLPPRVWR